MSRDVVEWLATDGGRSWSEQAFHQVVRRNENGLSGLFGDLYPLPDDDWMTCPAQWPEPLPGHEVWS